MKYVQCYIIYCTIIFRHFLQFLFPENPNVINYLSREAKDELHSLLSIDRNRPVEKRVLPPSFHEDEVCAAWQNVRYHNISSS